MISIVAIFAIVGLLGINVYVLDKFFDSHKHMLKHFVPLKEDMYVMDEIAEPLGAPVMPEEHEPTPIFEETYDSVRNAEVDARVEQLKEEIASRQTFQERTGYDAQVTHPGVENLPHSIIPDSYSNIRTEEYAR